MAQLGPVPYDEIDVVVRRQTGCQACANIKESRAQALKELPDGFYVCQAGRSKAKRLHRLVYCWMVPGVDNFVYSYKGTTHAAGARVRRSAVLFTQTRIYSLTSIKIRPLPSSPSPSLSLFFSSASLLGFTATIKFVSVLILP